MPKTSWIILSFLANKYGWRRLAFMVNTGTVAKNIFRVVEHILLGDIQNIVHGYFLLQVIGNVNKTLPNHLWYHL